MLPISEVAVPDDSTRVERLTDWEKLPVSVTGVKLKPLAEAIMLTWWLTLRTATLLSSPLTVQFTEPARLILGMKEDEIGVGYGSVLDTITDPCIHGWMEQE
jgi:hypothetical protein